MNNANTPAHPITNDMGKPLVLTDGHPNAGYLEQEGQTFSIGLTKREHFCLYLGIPETGDQELDLLIIKSERKKMAGIAMKGLLANTDDRDLALHSKGKFMPVMAVNALEAADALQAELNTLNGS